MPILSEFEETGFLFTRVQPLRRPRALVFLLYQKEGTPGSLQAKTATTRVMPRRRGSTCTGDLAPLPVAADYRGKDRRRDVQNGFPIGGCYSGAARRSLRRGRCVGKYQSDVLRRM